MRHYIIYFLGLLCVAAYCSCNKPKPVNEIIKVELASSGAWSYIGGAVSVDSSLRYNFYNNYMVKGGKRVTDYYVGKVSRQFWDTLNRKLEAINYKNIPEMGYMGGADVSYFELIVTWKGGKKRIIRERVFGSSDSSLINTLEWLNDSYRNVSSLKATKEPLKFETTYQAGGLEADEKKFFQAQEKKANK